MQVEASIPLDTQAILLLCGHFGGRDKLSAKPLSLSEYHGLAMRLRRESMRPSDLLEDGPRKHIAEVHARKIAPERLSKLLDRGVEMGLALESWTRQGIWVISRGDNAYPPRLKSQLKEAAPALLFGVGEQDLLRAGGLGMVGSRDADPVALRWTRELAARCASERISVVSGGARGVDREAMQAALWAGGRVLGILPEGVSRVASIKANREALARGQLTLVSVCHPHARWNRGHAMGRNKYIYALSDWTLAISSATHGGTWSGAIESLEKGLGHLLVRYGSDVPQGNTKLIERGATSFDPETALRVDSLAQYLSNMAKEEQTSQPVWVPSLFTALKSEVRELPVKYDAGASETTTEVTLPEAPNSSETNDLFTLVWPILSRAFTEERTNEELSEIAASFDLQLGQLKAWIKRAVDAGWLEKRTRPVRYIQRVR